MKGYPKHVATKQDYINLLAMPEYKAQALEDLKRLYEFKDDSVQKATTLIDPLDKSKGWNTMAIKNPNPMWKQKGFASRKEVANIIIANGGTLQWQTEK